MSGSHEEYVGWIVEPSGRGTFGILWSCSITLIISIWTALHLNVKQTGKTTVHGYVVSRFISKVLMAFIALVAQELVLSVAQHQFLVAWRYLQAVNDRRWKSCDDLRGGKSEIGMEMAFYAVMGVMGGFAAEGEGPAGEPIPVTLGISDLMTDDVMQQVRFFSTKEIQDKSKTSTMAKLIACVQAAWILLQCLGRKIQGLHITLLELNTMVHVMNAVVMYSIWWRKPADIALPAVIIRHNLFTDPDRPRKLPRTTLAKFDLVTNQVINIPGLFTPVEGMASSGRGRGLATLLLFLLCYGRSGEEMCTGYAMAASGRMQYDYKQKRLVVVGLCLG